jgi:hypothetical protein
MEKKELFIKYFSRPPLRGGSRFQPSLWLGWLLFRKDISFFFQSFLEMEENLLETRDF